MHLKYFLLLILLPNTSSSQVNFQRIEVFNYFRAGGDVEGGISSDMQRLKDSNIKKILISDSDLIKLNLIISHAKRKKSLPGKVPGNLLFAQFYSDKKTIDAWICVNAIRNMTERKDYFIKKEDLPWFLQFREKIKALITQ